MLLDDQDSPRATISSRAHTAALKRLSERANSIASAASSSTAAPQPLSSSTSSSSHKLAFSFADLGRAVVARLRSYGVRVDPGLTDEEIELVQAAFQITFPPDLRGILQQGLPLGPGFPDWRSCLGSHTLKLWIAAPKTGLCSDAELGLFWWRSWGARPPDTERAVRAARAALRRVPVLVPVFAQCYVPSSPVKAGNPILFVERSRACYCARELGDFFAKECFRDFVVDRASCDGGYCPEAIQQQERGAGLESARRMIARCVSSVGEDLDVVDAALADRRSSASSARSVLAGPRASSYGSRSSDGSADEQGGPPARSGASAQARAIRRIEFWSDLVEKGRSMNCAGSAIDVGDDEWEEGEGSQDEEDRRGADPWLAVKESVSEMAAKLRSAGWNERDVAEILDSCDRLEDRGASSSFSKPQRIRAGDRQSVIQGLAAHLDFLSACLRDAGWSIHDISDTLYSDLTGFAEHPSRARLSPEVASRIGVLAAFVAQG